jgi:hypothetical protein
MDLTGIGSVADLAKSIMGIFVSPKATEAERAAAQLQLQEILEKRETAIVEAQRAVIVAEMQQADTFTKRARPALIYAGLAFIFLVHVAFPIITYFAKKELPALSLPGQFWWAWTGVCGVWVIGRSAEKRGVASKLVGMVTGTGGK